MYIRRLEDGNFWWFFARSRRRLTEAGVPCSAESCRWISVSELKNERLMSKNDAELIQLRAENDMLKELLAEHGIAIPARRFAIADSVAAVARPVPSVLSPEAKIKLFRRLFHGRNDVYPIRWQSSKTGKAGYSPVCANEWRHGVCDKPRVKCGDCANSLYVPVTDNVIFRHLTGEITAGVYPLLPGDLCHFLAIDFDDADWREDARAVLQTCIENALPAALEISRSGEGAHLWLFFANATPARDVRRLGSALISATCARTRQLKLTSYDRLFPNQDTMPKGGFGNLIAMPLQKQPRDLGRGQTQHQARRSHAESSFGHHRRAIVY